MSGQKTLDVDIWMLAHLLLLHLPLPGSIKHCHSLHTCHAFSSLFRERWGFIAPITQLGICMRTLTDRYIKVYMSIDIQRKNMFLLVIKKKFKKRLHKGLIQKICFQNKLSFWCSLFDTFFCFRMECIYRNIALI